MDHVEKRSLKSLRKTETGGAHCCGHNTQLAGVAGAMYAPSHSGIAAKPDGQLIFFVTPAEKYGEAEFKNQMIAEGKITYGGEKCELLRIGAFDNVDAVLAHHIGPEGLSVGNGWKGNSKMHPDVPAAMKEHLGITETLLRLSVGLENVEDILYDLGQALS